MCRSSQTANLFKGNIMMRIIEVVESTTDPAEVESRWFEIAKMSLKENAEPTAEASREPAAHMGRHAGNGLIPENTSNYCLVDA